MITFTEIHLRYKLNLQNTYNFTCHSSHSPHQFMIIITAILSVYRPKHSSCSGHWERFLGCRLLKENLTSRKKNLVFTPVWACFLIRKKLTNTKQGFQFNFREYAAYRKQQWPLRKYRGCTDRPPGPPPPPLPRALLSFPTHVYV